jgi:hypothetical protein
MHAWCMPGPGIKLAGQALNMTAVTMMPKNRCGNWYHSVVAGGSCCKIWRDPNSYVFGQVFAGSQL